MNANRPISGYAPHQIIERLAGARGRLRALIERLPPGGWLGPRAAHLNPPLWEYGHIVWFHERWCLRAQADDSFGASMLDGADALYDSSNVPHDTRWDLPLPDPDAVDRYAERVSDAIADRLHAEPDDDVLAYFAELGLYHELMHVEAWWMAFQNLGYAVPAFPALGQVQTGARLDLPAGEIVLGSGTDEGFIFDNEKWRHRVPVAAFEIDAAPVSEATFAAFIDADGYLQRQYWSEEGWAWRKATGARHPLYWRRSGNGWEKRRFDRWEPIDSTVPMLHLNRFEAEACAAWMGRQLPSAAQWRYAVSRPEFQRGLGWEWTRDPFVPYEGFSPDPYRDYSRPWFDTHDELRGGGPVTDPALKRPGFRNFYMPHRRDAFTAFRTVGAV
ncbi:MAG TPA: selenoneine synthase SenA [Thiobacillaceae bacterium]|nr:selenoneine synthase SenA [Thiobacillaceae bacterium]